MKNILIQLDSDKYASSFDQVVAYDSGVDNIVSYSAVKKEDVRDIVYGGMFTRDISDLKNTAIFIGGSSMDKGEEILDAVKDTFFSCFSNSVLLDSNGSNTTSAAAVLKIVNSVDVKDKKVVVFGAGPVGCRAALHFKNEGSDVTLTDVKLDIAQKAIDSMQKRFGVEGIKAYETASEEDFQEAIKGKNIVLSAGPPKHQFLSEDMWTNSESLEVLADLNAVAPHGIEGIGPNDNGEDKNGKLVFGSLAIGGFKMKLHQKAVKELFVSNDKVLDAPAVYKIGTEL